MVNKFPNQLKIIDFSEVFGILSVKFFLFSHNSTIEDVVHQTHGSLVWSTLRRGLPGDFFKSWTDAIVRRFCRFWRGASNLEAWCTPTTGERTAISNATFPIMSAIITLWSTVTTLLIRLLESTRRKRSLPGLPWSYRSKVGGGSSVAICSHTWMTECGDSGEGWIISSPIFCLLLPHSIGTIQCDWSSRLILKPRFINYVQNTC